MASIVVAKHQYNYNASTIYIQLIHPGSPCIYLRSYLQTLQSLTTIHSGFLGRASWLANYNIWLFDSQPLPSLNRTAGDAEAQSTRFNMAYHSAQCIHAIVVQRHRHLLAHSIPPLYWMCRTIGTN